MSIEISFLFPEMEDVNRMCRADATTATRRRFGLVTTIPFDAGEQANGTATRVPVARRLLLAWQLTTHRTAKLPAGYRG